MLKKKLERLPITIECETEVHSNPKRIMENHIEVANALIRGLIMTFGSKMYLRLYFFLVF